MLECRPPNITGSKIALLHCTPDPRQNLVGTGGPRGNGTRHLGILTAQTRRGLGTVVTARLPGRAQGPLLRVPHLAAWKPQASGPPRHRTCGLRTAAEGHEFMFRCSRSVQAPPLPVCGLWALFPASARGAAPGEAPGCVGLRPAPPLANSACRLFVGASRRKCSPPQGLGGLLAWRSGGTSGGAAELTATPLFPRL